MYCESESRSGSLLPYPVIYPVPSILALVDRLLYSLYPQIDITKQKSKFKISYFRNKKMFSQ
jgi:hypothetical protein